MTMKLKKARLIPIRLLEMAAKMSSVNMSMAVTTTSQTKEGALEGGVAREVVSAMG